MKIIGVKFDTEENILNLISKSTPRSDAKLTFSSFTETAGWFYVKGNVDKSEFSINYSSAVFGISAFTQFFAELVNLKEDITIFLDYEGSYPMLYAKKVDKDTLRFIFAHDYILYKNDEDYEDCLCYKIEFDVLISKKELLGQFYTHLYFYLKKNRLYYDESFELDLKHANKHLDKIKRYLDKNLTPEEKETIEDKINKQTIPYPNTEPLNLGKVDFEIVPELKEESNYEWFEKHNEIYTPVYTYLKIGDRTETVVVIAEEVCKYFPEFISKLKNTGNAVYNNFKFAEEYLYAWLDEDNIRLLYKSLLDKEPKIVFDITVEKQWFYETAENVIKQMEKIAAQKEKWYNEYLKTKDTENHDEMGEWTKEMIKPENLIGPFDSVEEMMKAMLEDDENEE